MFHVCANAVATRHMYWVCQKVLRFFYTILWVSLVAQMVKNLPAVRETWVQSLGWEGPLEKGMATHSNILAWRIPWKRSLVGYSPWGHRESDTNELLTLSHNLHTILWKNPKELFGQPNSYWAVEWGSSKCGTEFFYLFYFSSFKFEFKWPHMK